jgi:hypothetical protein
MGSRANCWRLPGRHVSRSPIPTVPSCMSGCCVRRRRMVSGASGGLGVSQSTQAVQRSGTATASATWARSPSGDLAAELRPALPNSICFRACKRSVASTILQGKRQIRVTTVKCRKIPAWAASEVIAMALDPGRSPDLALSASVPPAVPEEARGMVAVPAHPGAPGSGELFLEARKLPDDRRVLPVFSTVGKLWGRTGPGAAVGDAAAGAGEPVGHRGRD